MLLEVKHETTYRFEAPRVRVIQSHRLTPSSNAGQTVLDWSASVEGGRIGAAFTDGAGDKITTLTLAGPVSEFTVSVRGTVETSDTAGVLQRHKEKMSPAVYLRKTRTTAPGVALTQLAEKLGNMGDALSMAHALSALVSDAVEYTPGSTSAGMTASEVLELGRGVCQDQTQVLIALARMQGIPARYVTGYLLAESADGAQGQSQDQAGKGDGAAAAQAQSQSQGGPEGGEIAPNPFTVAEAGHAWAELHIDGLGWVGLDPANRCGPDERYIRVGSGLDAHDAAPIRGVTLGGGFETMEISVHVAQQQ